MQDLPAQNRLTVKDATGNVLANANVKVYQATGKGGVWYGKFFDDIPDLELQSDANGKALLGRCPFSKTGVIEHTYGRSNGVLILRVEHDGKVGYAFLELTFFNLQYWSGNTALGNYEIRVNMIPATEVAETQGIDVPQSYVLEQNYPNPFNSVTKMSYRLPVTSLVSLTIYDLTGRIVAQLIHEHQSAGSYQYEWQATVGSGIYFCKLEAASEQHQFVQTIKIIAIK